MNDKKVKCGSVSRGTYLTGLDENEKIIGLSVALVESCCEGGASYLSLIDEDEACVCVYYSMLDDVIKAMLQLKEQWEKRVNA